MRTCLQRWGDYLKTTRRCSRLLAGQLYDPETELICGLRPAHFITLATPHLGCDADGPAQARAPGEIAMVRL